MKPAHTLSQQRHVAQHVKSSRVNPVAARKVASKRLTIARAAPAFPPWDIVWNELREKKVEAIKPDTVQALMEQGDWVLVDVRPKELYEKSTIEGAVNVPLFQAMDFSQANAQTYLKAAAYFFNGVSPVERNPKFFEQVKSLVGDKKAIVFCEAGGTLMPTTSFMTGKESRSLKAAWLMLNEGLVKEVAHLDGGVFAWYRGGFPMTGEYDSSNVGRTPNAADQPTLKDAMRK